MNPPTGSDRDKRFVAVCGFQGLYFLVTGLWPIFSIGTFQMVTGPKADLWLVRTVGALISVIAVALLAGAWRGRPTREVAVLAVGSAVVLGAVDVIYVLGDVIPPIYLADAALEGLILLAWGMVGLSRPRR